METRIFPQVPTSNSWCLRVALSMSPQHVGHHRIIADTVPTLKVSFFSGEGIKWDHTLPTIEVYNSLQDLRTQTKDHPAGLWITPSSVRASGHEWGWLPEESVSSSKGTKGKTANRHLDHQMRPMLSVGPTAATTYSGHFLGILTFQIAEATGYWCFLFVSSFYFLVYKMCFVITVSYLSYLHVYNYVFC